MMTCIGNTIGFAGSFPCIVCCPNPYKKIYQGKVGLVEKFGKFYKCVDPGLVKVNPVTENLRKIDITIQVTEIPKQDVITKDNVSVNLESVVYWHIVDPYQAVYGVTDVNHALVERYIKGIAYKSKTLYSYFCLSFFMYPLIEQVLLYVMSVVAILYKILLKTEKLFLTNYRKLLAQLLKVGVFR